MRHRITVFGVGLAMTLVASQALAVCPAGSVTVSPGFAGAINAAIASAGVGGTVCLAPGIYFENVVIDKTLTLIGDGATPGETIIDAQPGGVCNGPGIRVDNANDVRVENLTTQHACGKGGDDITVFGNGFDLVNAIVRGGEQDCLVVTGTGAAVASSTFLGCDDAVIVNPSGGAGPTISDCVIRSVVGNGIVAGGINAQITNNRISNVTNFAIDLGNIGAANNSLIQGNSILGAGGGITVDGDGVVVDDNTVEGAFLFALVIDGANPKVGNNSVSNSVFGIAVQCDTVCDQGFANTNSIFDTGIGLEVSANSNSYRIEDNQINGAAPLGLVYGGSAGSISGNVVSRAGVLLDGNGNQVTDNVAKRGGGSGIILNGASNTLTGNEARKNVRDGFTIRGTDNQLIDTRSVRNKGEGVDLEGTNTTITNLISRNNRIDCASDVGAAGVAAGSSAIVCDDGSNFAVPSEIDE